MLDFDGSSVAAYNFVRNDVLHISAKFIENI